MPGICENSRSQAASRAVTAGGASAPLLMTKSSHASIRTPGKYARPDTAGELEVTAAGPAADDPALLEGDDGGRVGGVAFGEGPGEMRDRVEHAGPRPAAGRRCEPGERTVILMTPGHCHSTVVLQRIQGYGDRPAYRWPAEPGRGKGEGEECLPGGRTFHSYDPGVSDRKIRVTVTLDPHLAAYAERLVEAGKAPSVSAVVNDALEAERQRDRKARRLWREAAERADPDQVARMLAHVEAQAAQLPASHRYR